MSKRRRFVATSLILSLGFVGIQFLKYQNRFWAIGVLGILTLVLFFWSFKESLGKNMSLLTLVLPVVFTLGVGVFWFLLPSSIYARVQIVIFYAIGIYILCLTGNIYLVASVRTIALLRAARGVGFVLSLLTSFLVFDAALSLKTQVYFLAPLIFISSFLIYLQGFWSVTLDKIFSKDLVLLSLISALITTEIGIVLFFWPVTVVVGSLFMTVAFYLLLGLGQAKIDERLFASTVKEHFGVGILIFLAILLSTHWGG